MIKRAAAVAALTCAPAFAHSSVDVALVSRVPELIARGATTRIEIVVDVRAFDQAIGFEATISTEGGAQFAAAGTDAELRCTRQSRLIECTAGKLSAGPHVVAIDVAVPASEPSLRLVASSRTTESDDPDESNNDLTIESRTYDAQRCTAVVPSLSVPASPADGAVDLSWSPSPGAALYDVLSGVDGETLAVIASTADTRLATKVPGGDVTFAVRARFADCPAVESVRMTVRSFAPSATLRLDGVPQSVLRRPVSAVVLPDQVIAADAGVKALFALDPPAGTLAPLQVLGDIVQVPPPFDGGIAAGPGGFLYFVDRVNQVVRIAFPPPRFIFLVAGKYGEAGNAGGVSVNARFNDPTGVAVDSRSAIYVSDAGNHSIRKIVYDGNRFDFVVSTLSEAFGSPAGIAVDGNGDVIVADRTAGAVRRLRADGSVSTVAAGLGEPYGLGIDGRGNIYVTELGRRAVMKIAPNGRVTTVVAAGLTRPGLLAVSADGTLWIPDEGSAQLFRTSAGAAVPVERRRAIRR